jgi:hypothetical protein
MRRGLGGGDPVIQTRLRRHLDRWLTEARAAGLDADGVEALYRAAVRDNFLNHEEMLACCWSEPSPKGWGSRHPTPSRRQ